MNDQGGWECTEVWQAIFDVELVDPMEFYGDPALPAIGDQHPDNSTLRLLRVPSIVPPKESSLKALNCTLVWSTTRLAGGVFERNRYIDSTTADKSWSHRIVSMPVEAAYVSDEQDRTARESDSAWSDDPAPIANNLGDLFIPGITRNVYMPLCRYSRNQLTVPSATLMLPGKVNNDEFTLDGRPVAIREALIVAAPISVIKRFESYSFRTVDYEILLKEDGWDEEILNKGFFWLHPDGPTKERVRLPNGIDEEGNDRPWTFAEEPVSLNVDGVYLDQWVESGNDPDTFVPHFRYFRHMEEISFTALGFS